MSSRSFSDRQLYLAGRFSYRKSDRLSEKRRDRIPDLDKLLVLGSFEDEVIRE